MLPLLLVLLLLSGTEARKCTQDRKSLYPKINVTESKRRHEKKKSLCKLAGEPLIKKYNNSHVYIWNNLSAKKDNNLELNAPYICMNGLVVVVNWNDSLFFFFWIWFVILSSPKNRKQNQANFTLPLQISSVDTMLSINIKLSIR